jgi:hypothetical protein
MTPTPFVGPFIDTTPPETSATENAGPAGFSAAALTLSAAEGFDAGLRLGHTLDRELVAVRVGVDR